MLTTIKNLPLTLFSRDFYDDLVHKCKGIGFGFIVVMVVLSIARPMVSSAMNEGQTGHYIKAFFHDLPALTMKGGQLSIDHASPYTITIGSTDSGVHILFDTDHELGDLGELQKKMLKEKTYVVVSAKDMAFLKDKNGTVQISTFSQQSDFAMTHDDLAAMGKKIRIAFLPFLFVSLAILFLIGTLIKIAIGAVIALIVSIPFKIGMGFDGGMRLMAAAAIPGVFLSTAFPVIPPLVTLPLWLGYGIYGLWAACKSRPAA